MNRAYILTFTNYHGYRSPCCVYTTIELARAAKEKLEKAVKNRSGKLSIQVIDVDIEASEDMLVV